MNFLNRTSIVIPFLLITTIVLSIFLYLNITKRIEAGDNPTIGVLSFKIRSIQRKYDGEVVWETIPTKTEIKNKDTIRTVSMSDAVLTLEDGTEIQIGENSMILVDFSDKKWNLNFAYGSVGAKKGSGDGLSIQSGDSKIEVGSGELSLDKSGDDLSINITDGDAKLRVGDTEQSISKDQTALVGKDGVAVKQQNFRLLGPSNNSYLTTKASTRNVEFTWAKTGDSIKKPKLVVAADLRFTRKIQSQDIIANKSNLNLKPGIYYWRIEYFDEENKQTSSSIFKFNLLLNEGIRLFTPVDGSQIATVSGVLKPISFAWSKSDLVSGYRLEISKDSDFSTLLLKKETRNNSIGISELQPGKYFFRVVGRPAIPSESEIVSEIRSIILEEKQGLDSVKLIEPSNKKNISLPSLKDSGVLFSWNDGPVYIRYEFSLAKDSAMSNPTVNASSNKNFYRWNENIVPGNYFWKVVGVTQSGEKVESGVNEFTVSEEVKINIIRPAMNSQLDFNPDVNTVFGWRNLPNTGKARILVSRSEDMVDPIINQEIRGTTISLPLRNPGRYYWKLNWKDDNSESNSEVMSFDLIPSIQPPRIVFPTPSSTVDMTRRNDLTIQWKTVEDADLYSLRIIDTTGLREREILSTRVSGDSYRFRDLTKLNQGKFRVEIRSLVKSKESSYTESRPERIEFFITLTTGITTKILTPERIYVE